MVCFIAKQKTSILVLGILGSAFLSSFCVQAQPPYPDQYRDAGRVSCVSNGGRVVCDANTRGGVQLVRQFQNSATCVQGQTWGYTERGVWVDRGCAGEFALTSQRQASGQIPAGTTIAVRTNERIDSVRFDNRIYTAVVDQDVWGADGRLAIPRGSPVELMVRQAQDGDLILDLESVSINGERYALSASPQRIDSERRDGIGANSRTATHVGGGALLGAIIGGIAGGGKGAAIGAAAGGATGAGLEMATRGREVHVPAESVVTFRLDQPLTVGVPDLGVDRDGHHYHDYYNDRP